MGSRTAAVMRAYFAYALVLRIPIGLLRILRLVRAFHKYANVFSRRRTGVDTSGGRSLWERPWWQRPRGLRSAG
ncbi:hypothetical protein SBA4_5190006 [Candidatus Sulfopaludibacter sp. SbA4]|nr:hypothetical protein SBA4_5190006 [Candidatus Sulfopaludibacter sp. SbA4]